MDSFIDEVSSYYKNEKLGIVKEEIDFDEVFQEEKEFIHNLPGADKIKFDYEFTGSAILVSDPLRLKTILTNILSNSIKYSDPSKDNPFVKVNVWVCEAKCKITIEDNGLGIRKDHQDKIFDMFFRSHMDIAGTGLGLYIVNDTIKRLGGEIEVSSEVGQGTLFQVVLPNLAESLVASN